MSPVESRLDHNRKLAEKNRELRLPRARFASKADARVTDWLKFVLQPVCRYWYRLRGGRPCRLEVIETDIGG
jgi:hypothetical protein